MKSMVHPRLRSRVHRGQTAVAAIAIALASLGVSWTAAHRKDRSVPFPCMDRACSCHNAAACKKHCCCFSDSEKLDWAANRGIDPVPFVSEMAGLPTRRPCCDARRREPSRSVSFAAGRHSDGRDSPRLVSIAAERQCHGLAQLWSVLAAALPSAPACRYRFDGMCTGILAQRTPLPIRRCLSPPTPPPRG